LSADVGMHAHGCSARNQGMRLTVGRRSGHWPGRIMTTRLAGPLISARRCTGGAVVQAGARDTGDIPAARRLGAFQLRSHLVYQGHLDASEIELRRVVAYADTLREPSLAGRGAGDSGLACCVVAATNSRSRRCRLQRSCSNVRGARESRLGAGCRG
jgi:hypothetical protein